MAKYRWIKLNRSVLLTAMDKAIPCLPGLPDWEDFRAWVVAGGVPDAELPGTPDPDVTTLQWFGEASPAFTSTAGGRVPPPMTQSGKFLKDDGSWATPATGGGSDPWTYLKVTSIFNISSVVFTDIPGLQFIPTANSSYEFETVLMLGTASSTINPQIGFRWPTGVTSVGWINQSQSPTAQIMAFGNNISTVRTVAGSLPTGGAWPSIGGGVIMAYGAAASSFAVQIRSESSSIIVAAAVGSYLKYRVY